MKCTERCSDPEAPDEAEAIASGAGAHQRAGQKSNQHPSGLPILH
jgi:hypothetical protein